MSVALPVVVPVARPVAYPMLGVEPRYDYFVDSVNGSDSNDGKSLSGAWASISQVNAVLASGDKIALVRGSEWPEQLGTSASISDVTVEAVGTGRKPILRGDDVASSGGWTKTGGQTNVYQRTWTHDDAADMFLSLWEDGTRLRWVEDVATCDSTAGSWYAADTTGAGSSTVYYHPTGSGDPASNGLEVEISKRYYGLRGGDRWTVRNVHTKRSVHNNGSFIVLNNSLVEDCIAEDGTKHNLFVAGSCIVKRTICWKADWADRTNSTQFIANLNDGVGHFVYFEDCVSIVDPDVVASAVADGSQGITGFAAHTDGVNLWDKVTYIGCSVSGSVVAFGANDCLEFISERCFATEADAALSSGVASVTVTDLWAKRGATVDMDSAIKGIVGTAVIDGLRSVGGPGTGRGDIWLESGAYDLTVRNSVFYRAGGSGYRIAVNSKSASGSNTVENSIFVSMDKGIRIEGTAASDDNVFYPSTMDAEIGANSYTSIAAYQAGESQDQNSIVADPQFADPENGDWTIGNSTVAATGAGLLRDVTSQNYTRIPADAELEAA